jgi:hypothetical protein
MAGCVAARELEIGPRPRTVRVGIDLDNTLVCYDGLFHTLARERGLLGREVEPTKAAVRDYLRACGREAEWTELQGEAYGPRMAEAEPFPGVEGFLAACRRSGVTVAIVSHRTRTPYVGARHDLHGSAMAWLERHEIVGAGGLSRAGVFLEPDPAAKAARVGALGCESFVDDLVEFLVRPGLPATMLRIHFDPSPVHAHEPIGPRARCTRSWLEIEQVVLGGRSVP